MRSGLAARSRSAAGGRDGRARHRLRRFRPAAYTARRHGPAGVSAMPSPRRPSRAIVRRSTMGFDSRRSEKRPGQRCSDGSAPETRGRHRLARVRDRRQIAARGQHVETPDQQHREGADAERKADPDADHAEAGRKAKRVGAGEADEPEAQAPRTASARGCRSARATRRPRCPALPSVTKKVAPISSSSAASRAVSALSAASPPRKSSGMRVAERDHEQRRRHHEDGAQAPSRRSRPGGSRPDRGGRPHVRRARSRRARCRTGP